MAPLEASSASRLRGRAPEPTGESSSTAAQLSSTDPSTAASPSSCRRRRRLRDCISSRIASSDSFCSSELLPSHSSGATIQKLPKPNRNLLPYQEQWAREVGQVSHSACCQSRCCALRRGTSPGPLVFNGEWGLRGTAEGTGSATKHVP
uniref:Uncharacterized protein n=1 Tax=Tetraselmis sp. GSL018 TaxID=582737 RepID=A0A061RQQ9_9CHLO